MRPLSVLEARVLGVLVEKQHTVPDSYPLSLNSLTLGCNQKTARDPVLNATESEVQAAVDALKALSLAFEASGSRVTRYEHNMGRVMTLPSQSVALLAVLMLRGPQTASELRANCERLHRFADVSSVEAFLDELAARPAEKGGALALKLPRAPGAREPRWTHLLGGAVDISAMPVARARRASRLKENTGMRFTVPEHKKLTHEMLIPIRWGDMDAMGHVNNTIYFRYFEIVRIEWFGRIGCAPNPAGQGPVIVNAFCNFIRQLEFPGEVLAKHYVTNAGRSSFDTYMTLERSDQPGRVYAEGGAKTVWVDFPKQRSMPMPDWLRTLVE